MFKKYIKYLWMLIAIPFALALASCNFINIGGNSEASGLDSESWNQVIDNFDTINYSYSIKVFNSNPFYFDFSADENAIDADIESEYSSSKMYLEKQDNKYYHYEEDEGYYSKVEITEEKFLSVRNAFKGLKGKRDQFTYDNSSNTYHIDSIELIVINEEFGIFGYNVNVKFYDNNKWISNIYFSLNDSSNDRFTINFGYNPSTIFLPKTHEFETELSYDEESHFYQCKDCDARKHITFHSFKSSGVAIDPNNADTYSLKYECYDCGYVKYEEAIVADENSLIFDYRYSNGNKFYEVKGLENKEANVVVIPETHDSLPVYYIDSEAFMDCDKIKKVIIPDSIIYIGDRAFKNCSSLYDITIPKKVNYINNATFENCTSLNSVVLQDGVTEISNNAFENCYSIKYFEFTSSVKLFKSDAFINARNYSEDNTVNFIGTISDWLDIKFENEYSNPCSRACKLCYNNELVEEIEIPEEKTSINNYAFYYCTSLTKVTMPYDIYYIEDYAFYDCNNLSYIQLPKKVTTIGMYAFAFTGFEEINLSSNLRSIGEYAFYCSKIKTIAIPSSVTCIEANTFMNSTLETIYINGAEKIADSAFESCFSLKRVSLPSDLKEIGASAFEYCNELEEIVLPDSLTTIGNKAFSECNSLKKITLNKNIKEIGNNAFYDTSYDKVVYFNGDVNDWLNISFNNIYSNPCYQSNEVYFDDKLLDNLVIPENIYSISEYAFSGIDSLKTVVISKKIKEIKKRAFENCYNLKDVKYLGSLEDWLNISFADEESNPCSNKANLYINDELVIYLDLSHASIINNYAFAGCSSIKFVTLGKNINEFGAGVFESCSNLEKVYIEEGLKILGKFAFCDCPSLKSINIPSSIKSIPNATFSNCENLASVELSKGIEEIGYNAFIDCNSFKKVNYLGTLEDWLNIKFETYYSNPCCYGADLYFNNELVTDLEIPDNVSCINYNFVGCSSIKSLVIHENANVLMKAFLDCSSLKEVRYLGPLDKWLDYHNDEKNDNLDFSNGTLSYALYINNELVEDLVIPEDIIAIWSYAFYGCSSIKSVRMHDDVKLLDELSFNYCINLKEVYLGRNIEYCNLPDVFKGCTSLTDIYYEGTKSEFESNNIYILNLYEKLPNITIHYEYKFE